MVSLTKQIVLIPYWVELAFRRKNLPLNSILDYGVVRTVLSIEDAAQLLNLQHLYVAPFLMDCYANHLLSSWGSSCTQELKVELDSSVTPLSYSGEFKENNFLKLRGDYDHDYYGIDNSAVADKNKPAYELVDFERKSLALVLKPGFIDYVNTSQGKYSLITALLKLFYVYSKVSSVSMTKVFSEYIKVLNAKVWGSVTS